MKLRYLIPFLLAGVAFAQTPQIAIDPLPPTWAAIAPEGTYQGTSPVVSMPAGTIFTFGLTTKGGVICDAMTATAAPVVVWVSTFSTTCKVNGVPTADPDPGQIKTLYVQSSTVAQNGTYTIPPSPIVLKWSVPASGGPTPPPNNQVAYTCSMQVTLLFGTTPLTSTYIISAVSGDGSVVTSSTPGVTCVKATQ